MARRHTFRTIAFATAAATTLLISPLGSTNAAGTGSVPAICASAPVPTADSPRTPADLADHYDLTAMHARGFDGRGRTAAVIEFGMSIDADAFRDWRMCFDLPGDPLTQTMVDVTGGHAVVDPTSNRPAPGREAQGDVEALSIGAPNIDRIHALIDDGSEKEDLAAILHGIADGSLTGGTIVDVVSLSFGSCETDWTPAQIAATEEGFSAIAHAGIWFFKAAGDAGPSECSQHPVCGPVNLRPMVMNYPGSSPQVLSIGGTEFHSGITRVWNSTDHTVGHEHCSAGGGGLSAHFATTPLWQEGLAPDFAAGRRVPDISALAGPPWYSFLEPGSTWSGAGGTSFATPFNAGAFASVRTALHATGVPFPADLHELLYSLAADPTTSPKAFRDIRTGNNRIYAEVDCCDATEGYDIASGLGELHFGALVELLIEPTQPVHPAFTG